MLIIKWRGEINMSLLFMAVHLNYQMERTLNYLAADYVKHLCDLIHCSLAHPSTESDHKEGDYITIQSFTVYCQYIYLGIIFL